MASGLRAVRFFVGNIPWTVSSPELTKYFSQFGPLAESVVKFNNATGLSRGFGFINFRKVESAEAMQAQREHILEGNTLTVTETDKQAINRD